MTNLLLRDTISEVRLVIADLLDDLSNFDGYQDLDPDIKETVTKNLEEAEVYLEEAHKAF